MARRTSRCAIRRARSNSGELDLADVDDDDDKNHDHDNGREHATRDVSAPAPRVPFLLLDSGGIGGWHHGHHDETDQASRQDPEHWIEAFLVGDDRHDGGDDDPDNQTHLHPSANASWPLTSSCWLMVRRYASKAARSGTKNAGRDDDPR